MTTFEDFHIHTLSELCSIAGEIHLFQSPGEIAARLETLTRELRENFSQNQSEGSRTMLDILMRNSSPPPPEANSLQQYNWQQRQVGEPIAWIDGEPIYSEDRGSGRREEDHATGL